MRPNSRICPHKEIEPSFHAGVTGRARTSTNRASNCPWRHKSYRRTPIRANCRATSSPSLMPSTASRCSGARAAGRTSPPTIACNSTRRKPPNENSQIGGHLRGALDGGSHLAFTVADHEHREAKSTHTSLPRGQLRASRLELQLQQTSLLWGYLKPLLQFTHSRELHASSFSATWGHVDNEGFQKIIE